jgi:hypothetical protein
MEPQISQIAQIFPFSFFLIDHRISIHPRKIKNLLDYTPLTVYNNIYICVAGGREQAWDYGLYALELGTLNFELICSPVRLLPFPARSAPGSNAKMSNNLM